VAAVFLRDRGATAIERNVRVGRGELDLVVSLGGQRVAVEVKTGADTSVGDPEHRFDDHKETQVRALAAGLGIRRVDYIGVRLGATAATVRWLPNVG
jgi:Holliday junction resolvase-like predicted endonuclease